MSRQERIRRCRNLGWTSFAAALVAALLAVWQWDHQWLATAGVLLVAALVFCIGSTS